MIIFPKYLGVEEPVVSTDIHVEILNVLKVLNVIFMSFCMNQC